MFTIMVSSGVPYLIDVKVGAESQYEPRLRIKLCGSGQILIDSMGHGGL